METLDIIDEILKNNSEIDFLTFYKYPDQILLQDKIECNEKINKESVETALEIRNKYHLPFRDALMLSLFDKEEVSKELLKNALFHHHNGQSIRTGNIEEICDLLIDYPKENLALNSKVTFSDNTVKHFFMLDFHVFPSTNNENIITNILYLLEVHGYILNSGESYHFISDSFVDLDSLLDLLAKSLFFAPIIDRAWVAHQLLERSCSLRVSKKHNAFPTVVKKV